MYLAFYKWMRYAMLVLPFADLGLAFIRNGLPLLRDLDSIQAYRAIYIIEKVANEVYSIPLLALQVAFTAMCSMAITISMVIGISFFSLVLCTITLLWLTFANTILSYCKSLYELSTEYIRGMKSKKRGALHRDQIQKTLASLRQCRVFSGTIYYIDRSALTKINDAIIQNIISNIFMFNAMQGNLG
jgi:hypothetical protein